MSLNSPLVKWFRLGRSCAAAKLGFMGEELKQAELALSENVHAQILLSNSDVPSASVSFVGDASDLRNISDYPSQTSVVGKVQITTVFLPFSCYAKIQEMFGSKRIAINRGSSF